MMTRDQIIKQLFQNNILKYLKYAYLPIRDHQGNWLWLASYFDIFSISLNTQGEEVSRSFEGTYAVPQWTSIMIEFAHLTSRQFCFSPHTATHIEGQLIEVDFFNKKKIG
jgi:hypothetical protein